MSARLLFTLIVLSACDSGGMTSVNTLDSGTYRFVGTEDNGTPLKPQPDGATGAELTLDMESLTLTLTIGEESQEASLTLLDEDEWFTACYTMRSYAGAETYRLEPDSLQLGDLTLEDLTIYDACDSRGPVLHTDAIQAHFE